MYYRRKILLALLEEFGGELANTDFQKLLFLFTERQNERSYDFVPILSEEDIRLIEESVTGK